MELLEVLAAPADAAAPARTMVVVAHPDDEVIGAGSRLPRLRQARFVYVTDGAPRNGHDAATHGLSVDEYRQRRREERAAALALCGVARDRVSELDCADQEAALKLARLATVLRDLIDADGTEWILTQPYEGGHPDHDATAFVAHAAAKLSRQVPGIVEMSAYHAGPQGLALCEFIPNSDADARQVTVELSRAQQQFKQSLIDCHASQRETLNGYPLRVERFRPAPDYDFRQPPHAGKLWYDARDWGMNGARFRELAAQALAELGIDAPR